MRAIFIQIIMAVGLIFVGSYIFEISFIGVAIFLTAIFFVSGIVTEGEYIPGQMFNSDGEELHPFTLLASLAFIFIILIAIGCLFPSLYNYGAYDR
ncbi:hypothetical protein GCM10009092_13720 [Bowmanella denitrificans]|uniref:Uncharacterized protein n=1 Tax=Bowmanella denitrificans TaxID=366582 RepID=A0ABP3GN61_9ALTE